MEAGLERDCSAIGGLFLSVMQDMRNSSPIWEDFYTKATKLHSSLKTTLVAIGAFLDAFQKVADMATGSRGATKEIGSALTRLCLRHKAIESKLKRFTGTIMEHLVAPLQDKMEDWKKTVAQLDKEHAKDYKKVRQEIKKCSSDTVRLQKKVKKGKSDMQGKLDSAMQEVNDKYILLEETQKNAARTALIEERGRFCLFIASLKPFVDEEVSLLTEVTHLQEIMDSLCMQADAPDSLPPSSEQVILDLKGLDPGSFNLQPSSKKRLPRFKVTGVKTPPSSPSSLGSRKSSMCSISSIASSSSGSTQSHSPSHHNRTVAQQQLALAGSLRLTSVSSQDSGFTSQDTLFLRPTTPSSLNIHSQNSDNASTGTDTPDMESTPTTPSGSFPNTPSASSTWTNWPNPPNQAIKTEGGRPHTISYANEKSHHARPALSSHLFEPPQSETVEKTAPGAPGESKQQEPGVIKRERPHSAMNSVPYSRPSASITKMQPVLPPLGPKPKSRAVAPPKVPPIGEQPVYANLQELAKKAQEQQQAASHEESDNSTTPTENLPPSPSPNGGPNVKYQDELDLTEAIQDLNNYTAALHGDFEINTPKQRQSKMRQNSMELAKAIRDLEASTAALESTYDTDSQASRTSLSSGYVSQDTIASGEYDTGQQDYYREQEKYFTIPRNSQMRNFRTAFQSNRPASLAGIPVSAQGGAMARRSSLNTPKPPPPVRRSSSITTANPAVLQKYRASPPKQLNPQDINQSWQMAQQQQQQQQHQQHHHQQQQQYSGHQYHPQHRRSHSASGSTEPAYAELQEIQQSIQEQQRQSQSQGHGQGQHVLNHGNGPGRPGTSSAVSAPVTPQYATPVTTPGSAHNNVNVVNSLNARFAAINTQSNNSASSSVAAAGAGDFDLPPPPTDDELREMEQIYSVPKPSVSQTPQYVSSTSQAREHSAGPPVGGDMRQSIISEMKQVSKFRKVSQSEDGTEC